MLTNRRVLSLITPSKQKLLFSTLLIVSFLHAETLDDVLEGFDDEPIVKKTEVSNKSIYDGSKTDPSPPTLLVQPSENDVMDGFDDESKSSTVKIDKDAITQSTKVSNVTKKRETFSKSLSGLTGKITEQVAYSYSDDAPHDNISSLKTSLLLDYEHKFENGFKFKTNGKAYYDAIYDIRGEEKYSRDELDELQSEVELYDAYIEGSISDNLDMKIGRQVVVWGRSDTIRVTDILNPLDNRRPGMVDIEDLRLPVAMAKFDYFVGDWRVTPMAIVEQRFSKNPPAASAFNPNPKVMDDEDYSGVTPALSVGAEFSGWDVNFYAAKIRDDAGYVEKGKVKHDKVNMVGTALNVLSGSWLFKSELAHFDEKFSRVKGLLGTEYNGIADTLISYDVAIEKTKNQDEQYQHAFRVSSDFMNATVKGNYLISLFGKSLDEGGFQRAWLKYDVADGIYTNIGVVDYMGGSKRFDAVKNNDMAFMDVTYSF